MKPRKLKWTPQPFGSKLCGQACVAMLAKVSLKKAIEACGRGERGTRAKDILKALRTLGVEVKGTRLITVNSRRMPQRCLQMAVFVHYSGAYVGKGKTIRHWRIQWDGQIYDPEYGISLNGSKPSEMYWSRVSSYLEI